MKKINGQSFPIPGSLHDLESEPYNLQPYPFDFNNDDDEAARANSFDNLVDLIEEGNQYLTNAGFSLFENEETIGDDNEDHDEWMDHARLQALYTLVRKSTSIASKTRNRLISALCEASTTLCEILSTRQSSASQSLVDQNQNEHSSGQDVSNSTVVPQSFRDAFACHLYMLYNIMCFAESEHKNFKLKGSMKPKISNTSNVKDKSKNKKNSYSSSSSMASNGFSQHRKQCVTTMLRIAQTMSTCKNILWVRGVPDENAVSLPSRIACQIIESSTSSTTRKADGVDEALGILTATIASADYSSMNTIISALLDLLHSYEHVAVLVAELCSFKTIDNRVNRLAVQLLQEIGRSEYSIRTSSTMHGDASGKASGIKNIAPFISHLAELKPQVVLENILLVLPLLDAEPYMLRNSVVYAIGNIVARYPQHQKKKDEQNQTDTQENIDYSHDNQSDSDSPKEKNSNKTRDSLLDVLTERVHDKSSYTRCAVLKVWAQLAESSSIPLTRIIPVTELATDRLQDVSVNVRSKAMKLLTLLLENNPFSGSLNPIPYQNKVDEVHQFLFNNVPEKILEETREAAMTMDKDDSKQMTEEQIQHTALAAAIDHANQSEQSDGLIEQEVEYCKKVAALRFMSSALAFIQVFEGAKQNFKSLLLSSNPTDVTEALRFFVKARHFDLPCAVTGIKDALALMWSPEKKVKDEVLRGFVEVFIAVPTTASNKDDEIEFLPDKKIAHNLLVLVGQASISELASIEEAIGCLVREEKIPVNTFLVLWAVASKAPGDARAAAMLILSMGAKVNNGIVDSASRLRLLYDAGLGEYAEEQKDWKTARSAAIALQQVPTTPRAPQGSAKALMLEQIVERLHIIVRGDWCNDDDIVDTNGWFSAAEQVINAIFIIAEDPERVCGSIIRDMEELTFGISSGDPKTKSSIPMLTRFFFVIGHVALKLLVYTEALGSQVRRANAAKSLSKQESADKARVSNMENPDQAKDDDIENELGVAAEAEAETERKVDEICEREIVGRGLIGLFSPLLLRVVMNEDGSFQSDILMQSATLTLCKFMAISSSYCEKHLPVLFSRLENTPTDDITLRSNIIVALGDLAFRFPNAVEPYTSKIYACLRDKSDHVKRHTLMVLTHLILNDMVKVKGQVCEIALCLEDDEARIRDLARLLFHELSKRSNNPIYNLLPDIISRLSQQEIPKETFRKIMTRLLGLIQKERQIETLVVKITQRFATCDSISQKADLAYCLANLPKMNEKCLKSLNDNFKLYKDALFDEDVFNSFADILTKAEKNTKNEMKDLLQEWREKITSENKTGLENHLAGNKAKRAKARAAKRNARNKNMKATKSMKKKVEYEGETDEEESSEEESEEEQEMDKENMTPQLSPKSYQASSKSNESSRPRRLRQRNA